MSLQMNFISRMVCVKGMGACVCIHVHTHTHTRTLYLAQDKCVSVCVYVSRHAFVCMCITSTSLCRFWFTGPLVDDQSVWKKSTPTNITWN